MIKAVVVACLLAAACAVPLHSRGGRSVVDESMYTVIYDTPEGRHLQMGEPGKAVTGFFQSRSADGTMMYTTNYEADEKGYRASGDHLPSSAQLNRARSGDSPNYIFNYDAPSSHSHYLMGEPGKAVEGSYMYYDAEGRATRVNYVADEDGFRIKPEDQPVAELRSGDDAKYVFKYDAPGSHSHYLMGEPGKAVEGSYMYYDAQGRANRVDYIADDQGYRVKATEQGEQPAAVESREEAPAAPAAEPIPAADPPKEEVAEPVADPAPVAEAPAEPSANTRGASVLVHWSAPNQIPVIPAVASVAKTEDSDESNKVRLATLPVSVPYPGFAYYHGALPYVLPLYRRSPYGFGYAYSYGYPYGGNYAYVY